MKTMLRKLRKLFAGGALALAACDDPIDRDPNANKDPAVVDIHFADALAYDSLSQFGEGDPVLFQHLVEGTIANIPATNQIIPFMYPRVVFNKLMNGDTLELAEKERDFTGGKRELGYCRQPAAPAVVFSAGQTAIPTLKTCYSPSDKILTVQPGVEAVNNNDTPDNTADDFTEVSAATSFLNYGQTYTIAFTPAAKDKKGKSLNYSGQFVVRPFELLAADDNHGVTIFAADVWPRAVETEIPAGTAAIRFVFSGPISALTDKKGTVTSDPASVLNVPGVFTDADGNEVTAINANSETVRARFTQTDPLKTNTTTDPRILYMLHPDYLAETEAGGFAPGTYRITLPATFADNGTVTGNPVSLGQPIEIEFTVVE